MAASLLKPWLLPRELVAVSLRSFASRSYSAPPSKFSFLTSYAFHGKPEAPEPPPSPDAPHKRKPAPFLQGFAADSPIAAWRDEKLSRMPWGAGHDWLFVKEHEGTTFMGVADGVGGWSDSGVDPSHFAQAFLFWCEKADEEGLRDPREVMWKGFHGVRQEKDVLAGSSTACILALDPNGILTAANLGDSTFFIIREGQVVHAQPSQTHFFNAPRQIAKLPSGAPRRGALIDSPDDADIMETELLDGDMVIVATDGFSDNVWPGEMQELVKLLRGVQNSSGLSDQELLDRVTVACVNFARMCSVKENKETPFEVEARRYGETYRGGKVDDTLVIAALVKRIS